MSPIRSRHLFHNFHLPAFSLDAFPFTDEDLDEAGLLGEGESLVILHIYATLTISIVDISDIAVQALETMRNRPDLLSEHINFFLHVNPTYHRPFRTFHFHSAVY